MDFYMELLGPVFEHLAEHKIWYIGGAAAGIPFFYFTRKVTVPLIFYLLEISVYLSLMHGAVHLLVRLTAWFKVTSSMKALRPDGTPSEQVDWMTPLFTFWERELYEPNWILYMEACFAAIVLMLVFRYRPMATQHKPKPKYNADGTPISRKAKKEGAEDYLHKYRRRNYAEEVRAEDERLARLENQRRK